MDRPELVISVDRAPTETVVTIAGELDMLTAPRLAAAVNDVLADPPQRVALDMAGITFCDSQGLGTLVVLSRKATTMHSLLVLTNVAGALQRVLDITGLRSALVIRKRAQ